MRRLIDGPRRSFPNLEAEEPAIMPQKHEACDNLSAPRYIAMVAEDYLESDNDLDVLLGLLRELHDPAHGEDICVWCEDRTIAAIMKADGRIIRFDSSEPAVQAPAGTETNPDWLICKNELIGEPLL